MNGLVARFCQRCGKDLGTGRKRPRYCPECRLKRAISQRPYQRGPAPELTPKLEQAGFQRLTNRLQFRAFVAGHTIDFWPNRQRWKLDFGVSRHGTDADVLAFMRSCLHEDIPAPYRRHLQPTRTRHPV